MQRLVVAVWVGLCLLVTSIAHAQISPQPKLYVASPLGFSEAGREFMYHCLVPELSALGYEVIDPWNLTDKATIAAASQLPYGDERRRAWQKLDPEIGERDRAALDGADKVLAVLDGSDVDSGTASEIGYAFARNKPIFGYRNDFRLSSDNEGAVVNLQVEYFIRRSGGMVFQSLKDLNSGFRSSSADRGARAPTAACIDQTYPTMPAAAAASPSSSPFLGSGSSKNASDPGDVISFFKAAFTIILSLAFGEAFKQFVSDRDTTEHVYRDRFPALLTFLFLFFPFFQGMSRWFTLTYGEVGHLPQPYSLFLMIDGINFIIEAGCFFVMSRALAPQRAFNFYLTVLILLGVDSIWALFSWYTHGVDISDWLWLNVVSVIVLVLILFVGDVRQRFDDARWRWFVCFLALLRTAADYYLTWPIYFPRM